MRRCLLSSSTPTTKPVRYGRLSSIPLCPRCRRSANFTSENLRQKGGQSMLQASKTVEAGIFFALLISGMFMASRPLFGVGSESSEQALALVRQNEVKTLQQALRDEGHYRRRVEGVIGLRTRASVRAFQNADMQAQCRPVISM